MGKSSWRTCMADTWRKEINKQHKQQSSAKYKVFSNKVKFQSYKVKQSSKHTQKSWNQAGGVGLKHAHLLCFDQ